MKMRIVKCITLFISLLIISSCASYDFKSNYQHGVNLDDIAQIARKAVEDQFDVDLSHVTWELADKYRLNRLAYQSAYNECKVMVSHPFYSRLLSSAASSNSSSNILGRYKENVKKIYINPGELDYAYSYDLKDIDVATQIYLALFIHEFVHAADFEKFSDGIKRFSYLPGQSELLGTLLEGNAEYLTEKICEKYKCEEGYEILDKGSKGKTKKEEIDEPAKNKTYSKIYKQELKLKYQIGKKYISAKYKQNPDVDPMPRKLSELADSQMLILYPENKRLINTDFKTANQMMEGINVIHSEFSNQDYIYHYEVFSPPRLTALLKFYSGIKLSLSKNTSPPYYQGMTLKLINLAVEDYYEFDSYSLFMIMLEMGEKMKSQQFIKKVADGWDIDFRNNDNFRYVAKQNTMVVQYDNFVLLLNSNEKGFEHDVMLKVSQKILGSL